MKNHYFCSKTPDMLRYFSIFILFAGIISLWQTGCSSPEQGYSIKVRLNNQVASGMVYLKQYDGFDYVVIDSLPSDQNGEVAFNGNSPLRPGTYSTGVKEKNEADFFISFPGSQHFSITFDPTYPRQTLQFTGSSENQAFITHLRGMDAVRRKLQQFQGRIRQNLQNPDSVQAIQQEMEKFRKETAIGISDLEQQHPGSVFALFLKSTRDPEIPEPNIPLAIVNRDQAMEDYYYRQMVIHFFDPLDFSDSRLVYLTVLKQKMGFYFRQLVYPQPDSIISRIEDVLAKTKKSTDVFAWSARYLYNMFRETTLPEYSAIPVFVAENYILAKPELFNDSAFISKVRNRTEKAKLNPVGAPATNLKLQTPEGKTLQLTDIVSPVTVLYFFNPGCEACHAITDRLNTIYQKYKSNGLKVFAVYIDRNREEWLNYISSKKLNWTNTYDQEGTEGIEQKYDLYAIPMIYLLDQDKKVIVRDLPVEALEGYLMGILGNKE